MEEREKGEVIVEIDDTFTSCSVKSREYPGQFSFDRIFDWSSSQVFTLMSTLFH
jgi:hypothetical protein